MDTEALLGECERRGVPVWAWPSGRVQLPADRLAEVEDLLPALRASRALLWQAVPFARSGQVLRVRSAVLGEDIWLAADNADCEPDNPDQPGTWRSLVVWRAAEVRLLRWLHTDPQSLRTLHESKRWLGGSVVQSTRTDGATRMAGAG